MAFGGADEAGRERAHYDARDALADLTKRCAGAKLLPPQDAARQTVQPSDPDLGDEGFASGVDVLKERIRAGDVYQIVPSRSFRAPDCRLSPKNPRLARNISSTYPRLPSTAPSVK